MDAVIVAFSFLTALYLRVDSLFAYFRNYPNSAFQIKLVLPFIAILFVLVFWFMKLYSTIWHYAGLREIGLIGISSFSASALSFLVCFVYALYMGNNGIETVFPRSVFIIAMFLVMVLISVERFALRAILRILHRIRKNTKSEVNGNLMIIGAGDGASLFLNNIHESAYYSGANPICLIDDDPSKKGLRINNVKVMGTRQDIIRLAKELNIDMIIFCIPSCPSEEKSKILKICQKTGCKLKTLPSVYQIESEKDLSAKSVRNVEIEDLLGRDPIKLENDGMKEFFAGKTVLVTGGGGSIGSELCRQIAANKPEKLIIFDIYENNAYDIQNEILRTFPELELHVRIGSVRDTRRIEQIFRDFHPHIVYHAAAHKHVPLMEDSPNEAIKNNVFGTLKTVRAADKFGAERFVLISTDKAVNPTNIMGASKRMCEMVVQAYDKKSETDFVAVRFGNVLGSNGSVIPLFKKQIAEGGPVTVTDPNIIRYFMTIPEAVSLVLKAGANANGGEIFVLDMGDPVKILDLAENLISLSGYTPYVDMDIVFTGLRPGEKKFEELLMDEEGLKKTYNELIYIGKPITFDEDAFLNSLDEHKEHIYDEGEDIRDWVKRFVPTYHKPE
ncbi:MAG: polysaccharide biosynthesis protein [Clostridia bacterium]|nr:polysaccharide biosynthesis protein [Clostridia bacterium]